ncbi:MAG: glucosamine-6-phosphate deaminase [candidate division WOR-3 bacterium]
MLKLIITSDYEEMSKLAAKLIAEEIKKREQIVLGLATGNTPLGTYKELIRLHKEEGLDFSDVITFNLDEYLGLSPTDRRSYNFYMWENLFYEINIRRENVHIPRGDTSNPEEFCKWYEEEIKRVGGIDLQLLGIGRDGHIGFNEPGSSFSGRTRVKKLAEVTIRDNARFFDNKIEDVPHYAISMGIGTILEAEKIILIANGEHKAEICARFIEGPVTKQVPASSLQLHSDVTVILDKAAASRLERTR